MHLRPILLASLLLTALLPSPALGQDSATDLRGVIVHADDGRPVPTATVAVEGGPTVLAGRDGSFRVRGPVSGPVRLRIEQIGFATLDTVVVAGGGALRLALRPRPIPLDGLVVVAAPDACTGLNRPAGVGDDRIAALMDEFPRNAERQRLMEEERPLELTFERVQEWFGRDGESVATRTDTVPQRSDGPVPYEPGEVLFRSDSTRGYVLRVPNVASIASDTFQRHHCFHYAGVDEVAGERFHRLDFVPAAGVRTADVAGSLFLGVDDLILRRSEFRLVNVPAYRDLYSHDLVVNVWYMEFEPYLVGPVYLTTTQGLRRVRFDGQRVDGVIERLRLIDH